MSWAPKAVKTFGRAAQATEKEDVQAEQERQVSEVERQMDARGAAYQAEKDVEFYSVLVFKSQAQRDAFATLCGLTPGLLLSGLELARKLGKQLPPDPPLKERRIQGRWERLVRR